MQIRNYFVSLQLLLEEWIDEFGEIRIERIGNPPRRMVARDDCTFADEKTE